MREPMAPLARPRVALVAGDADSTGQLRAAMAGHFDVVYAASAAEFDDARLQESGATAALVNLDGGDWLDGVERRLADAGVAVVFNDPDSSASLAGWEQARWLRHLTAKLCGSTDYDPPRPPSAPPLCASPPASRPSSGFDTAAPRDVGAVPVATTEAAAATPVEGSMPTIAAPGEESPDMQSFSALDANDADAASPPPSAQGPQAEGHLDAQPHADEPAGLDLDTAALSAMIDARLAEPELQASPESTEVWRVAGDETTRETAARGGDAVALTEPVAPVAAPVEDKDVLKGLPSVDDWQLVDPETPLAAVAAHPAPQQSQPEPAVAGGLAGLELVPLDTTVAIERPIEPIERWMRVESGEPEAQGERKQPAVGAGGDAA